MPFSEFTAKNLESVAKEFCTDSKSGLTAEVVQHNLAKFGYNEIKVKEVKWWQIFIRQFNSAFIYLLIAAAILGFLFGEKIDGFLILLFIAINTGLGFYQEFKSQLSLKELEKYVVNRVKVIRDGTLTTIDSKLLVPGDLLVFETGDILPADVRVTVANDLLLNESVLTGESIEISKNEATLASPESNIYKAKNILFSGTTVADGGGRGIVIATGKRTEIGKITKLSTETQDVSSFEKQIAKFSNFILYLTGITLLIVFVIQLLTKSGDLSVPQLIIFSIAMAVGVIPEALPLVTTFSLTHGAIRLAKKKVIAKRLSSIEDLGSIEILCSDKTGTLTQNIMSVAEVRAKDKNNCLYYAATTSDYAGGDRMPNNSFDLAIIKACALEIKGLAAENEKIAQLPFNPTRRRSSVLVKSHSGYEIVVRGAPEEVLPYVKSINSAENEQINSWRVFQGMYGRRVLALARKPFKKATNYIPKDEESDLELIGLISFEDPIKPTTLDAVNTAKQLGIEIKILTGDSPDVAGAVATKVGIISDPKQVLLGSDLEGKTLTEKLSLVKSCNVFARVSPEQKYKIIELLEQNHEVGYLGEGINDAPALKLAHVGIVVDGASAVARESSDIILLENDLRVIMDGISEGRRTFVNTTKYIKSTLASNFGNFYALAFASLLIDYLPMLPIQILLVNLLSDFPMISISTDEVEPDELKRPHSYDVREITLIASVLGIISTLFDFIFFGVFQQYGPEHLRTYWFIGSILTELLLIYSIRTKKVFFKTTKLPSLTMELLTGVAAAVTIMVPAVPTLAAFFGFVPLELEHLITVLAITLVYFLCTEVIKHIYYSKFSNFNHKHA